MGVSEGRCAETAATAVAARAMLLKRIVRGWFEIFKELDVVLKGQESACCEEGKT